MVLADPRGWEETIPTLKETTQQTTWGDMAQKLQFENAWGIEEGELFTNLGAHSRGTESLEDSSRNKGADRYCFPPLPLAKIHWSPARVSTVPIFNYLHFLHCISPQSPALGIHLLQPGLPQSQHRRFSSPGRLVKVLPTLCLPKVHFMGP